MHDGGLDLGVGGGVGVHLGVHLGAWVDAVSMTGFLGVVFRQMSGPLVFKKEDSKQTLRTKFA